MQGFGGDHNDLAAGRSLGHYRSDRIRVISKYILYLYVFPIYLIGQTGHRTLILNARLREFLC